MQPVLRVGHDGMGRSRPHLEFRHEGRLKASTGTFICRKHDDLFKDIDTTPMDFNDPRICDLLFYRAVLKEAWLLLRMQDAQAWIEKSGRVSISSPNHPYTRLRALLDLKFRLEPFLSTGSCDENTRPVDHWVRHVKGDYPIIAASYASGGSNLGFDRQTGAEVPPNVVKRVTRRDPNTSWGFTVIPQQGEHTVLASWVKGSSAQDYFRFLSDVDGEELQAAVSAELICFCENWFLHPRVWASYSRTKRHAIISAYDNVQKLHSGTYHWRNETDKVKWYDDLEIPNRHQINLFRYKESVFA